jgi:signal transduction histidine kinase
VASSGPTSSSLLPPAPAEDPARCSIDGAPGTWPAAGPTAGRPDLARSLRAALVTLAAVAATLAGIEVALIWDTHQPYTWLQALFAVQGLGSVVTGAVAWDRRPANRTGLLLCVLGASTMAAAAGAISPSDKVVFAVGSIAAELPIAALLHLVLAFPSGRVRSRSTALLVAAGYLATVGFEIPRYAFGPGVGAFPGWHVHLHPTLVATCADIENWVGTAVIVAGCVDKAVQIRNQRRGLDLPPRHLPALAYGIGTILFLPFSAQVLQPALGFDAASLFVLQMVAFAWVPVVYATAVLRDGFARSGHIEELGAWLAASRRGMTDLRDALAATVGDPTLQLQAWPPDGLDDLRPHPGRASFRLEGREGPLATVVYDRALIDEPAVVRSACQLVAIALERQQLSTELLASQEKLRESRTRLVHVADAERRRLAHDLHDVLQSRLVLAALHAGRLAADTGLPDTSRDDATQLRRELLEAITDLRHQVQGLMPALLIERGLPAAIEELADRLPLETSVVTHGRDLPIPPAVATTGYLIVAEAFTNSLKHARASRLTVRLELTGRALRLEVGDDGVGGAVHSRGTGLRGIEDRVEALDGTIAVHSPEGGGTTISVALPCAS